MRWGKTLEQQQQRYVDEREWHPAFLWLPARLIDGRWCWLEAVERISYMSSEIPVAAPTTPIFNWCYREVPNDAA